MGHSKRIFTEYQEQEFFKQLSENYYEQIERANRSNAKPSSADKQGHGGCKLHKKGQKK